MTHKRQEIRDAIVGKLSAISNWSGRVFANRTRPTEPHELPVFLVYTTTEEASVATVGRRLLRRLTVAIELRVGLASNLDDELDAYAKQAELAMAADPKLGSIVIDSHLTSTTIGLDGEGDSRQALATLTYVVQYQTDGSGV